MEIKQAIYSDFLTGLSFCLKTELNQSGCSMDLHPRRKMDKFSEEKEWNRKHSRKSNKQNKLVTLMKP